MSRAQGLTLVELLVALSILVVVSASTALIFRGISRAWQVGSLKSERYQQARLLLDLFERELSSCLASTQYPMIGQPAGSADPLWEGASSDRVFFVGALTGRAGLTERGYWVNAQQELMCHDEAPADGDPATGLSERCGREVAGLQIRYYDGAQWQEVWDSGPVAALPQAIRVTLTLGAKKPETFETVVHVPAS